IEQRLRVDDILVAVRIKREDAHAAAKFEIDDINCVADANDEVGGTKGAGDGWKGNAPFEVELRPGGIEKRRDVGESWPQRVFDVIVRNRVIADRLADEAFE